MIRRQLPPKLQSLCLRLPFAAIRYADAYAAAFDDVTRMFTRYALRHDMLLFAAAALRHSYAAAAADDMPSPCRY